MKKGSQNTSIRVFCRLRPLNKLEMSQGGECCVEYTEKTIKVKVVGEEKPYDFSFDGIFGPESAQVEVFNKVAKPVIDRLMEGYNGTLFAYGQTSSGKTFTMEGPDIIDSDDKKGIIPRMMSHLFNLILNSSEHIEFHVKVSFLELYNEKLQDLLDPRKNNLQIKEDKAKGIFVQDATEIYVTSAEQMKQVHKSGSENRTIAATRMNERSSRSHSIFVLHVTQKDTKTDASKSSKLYFVDLAGSEKISKTNVTGQQLEEAKNINKSLTSLGMVINALTEKSEKGHVPYRDSKLTRLLQESLGGNSQTSLILACSMCSYNDKEILGTLRFGNRAKNIKNTPVVNVERSVKELVVLLEAAEKKIREQEEIIQGLQQQLDNGVSGNSSFMEMTPVNNTARENILEAIEEKPKTPILAQPQGQFTFQISNEKDNTMMAGTPGAGAGAGAASLTLLKQHIQLVNLNEEVQDIKLKNKELEAELANKTLEVYDLIGKVMQYENQIQELTTKNLTTVGEYQVKMEKLCTENQKNTMLMSKFKRAIGRLRSDLNFAFISKNLKMLEADDRINRSTISNMHDESQILENKEDLIVNSIQKTIEMLEEIEKDIDEKDNQQSYLNEVEQLMESFGINSQGRTQQKLVSRKSLIPGKHGEIGLISHKSNPAEVGSTFTDEEIKANTTVATEESTGEIKEPTENIENIKIELENEDDLMQKIQSQSLTEEEKIIELQNLIATQRKTIHNLNKMNNELAHAVSQCNQKYQASQDKKNQSYKNKIEDLQRFTAEKAKEYEKKIQSLKSLLEEKLKELQENKTKYDDDLQNKAKLLSDLKFQNERMQKIILGNDLAKRVYELEGKMREFTLERQKLFEDMFKLRGEVDEKEDLITDKNAQIQILQANLNTLSSELEILKHVRPQQGTNLILRKDKKETFLDLNKGSQKNKKDNKETIFFDKHVVKPIRGGGGNVKNFERDNYLIFEKPSMLESSEFRSNPRAGEKGSKHESGASADSRITTSKPADNFKKFDEMLNKKNPDSKKNRGRSIKTLEEDEEEPNLEDVKQKLKHYSTKNTADGQKSIKSFFTGVKNLFS